MPIIESFHQIITIFAITGIILCLTVLFALQLHRHLRAIVDRFRSLGGLTQCFTLLTLSVFVAYGSTKPNNGEGAGDGDGNASPRRTVVHARQTNDHTPQTIAPWTARGAWNDWTQIAFPEEWTFPYELQRLSHITLMSQGALRSGLTNAVPLLQFPQPLALEPDVSSVSHGLTPSNSYLIIWHNALVNRCTTNRVDASFELFSDGASTMTIASLSDTNVPPSVVNHPHTPPDGYVGNGQDESWVRGNFALLQEMTPGLTNVEQVLSVGYENWLRNWVGINEMNGRYQAAITIPEIPDGPCYLECGPWKMVLTAPGTYRFPLMVFEAYRTRAYPDGIHFRTDYDDGYRGIEASFEIQDVDPQPARARRAAQAADAENRWAGYDISTFRILYPIVIVDPKNLPLNEAQRQRIELWTNMPVRHWAYESLIEGLHMIFNDRDQAEISQLHAAGRIRLMCTHGINTSWGILTIDEVNSIPYPEQDLSRSDDTIFGGDQLYESETNSYTITHFTVTTTNTMNLVHGTTTIDLPEGQSCYAVAILATAEDANNPTNFYNDVASWHVSANGNPDFTGSTSVYEHELDFQEAEQFHDEQYGIRYIPIVVGSQFFEAHQGESLQIHIDAMVQNIQDSLRQTCLQIVLYPISPNGIEGLPDWINL